MTGKQLLHRHLANLALNRIDPNPGGNPETKRRNDKLLKVARWHIRMAGGDIGKNGDSPRGK